MALTKYVTFLNRDVKSLRDSMTSVTMLRFCVIELEFKCTIIRNKQVPGVLFKPEFPQSSSPTEHWSVEPDK